MQNHRSVSGWVGRWKRVVAFLLLAALSLTVLPRRHGLQPEGSFALLLAIPLLLSFPEALNRGAAIDRVLLLAGAILVYLAARSLPPVAARALLHLMVAGGAILALYGIWQFLFGLPQLLTQVEPGSPAATRLATGRVFSRFLLPSAFASFLLLVLPQALAAGVCGSRRCRPPS